MIKDSETSPLTKPTLATQLERLYAVRTAAIIVSILIALVVHLALGVKLPLNPIFVVLIGYIVLNLVSWLSLKKKQQASEHLVFLQLSLDVLMLSALLYLTGGSTNPFVSLLLIPLIFTITLLSSIYYWLMAGLTILCYSILLFWYVPVGDIPPHMMSMQGMTHGFRLHIIGMWFNFVISAVLILMVAVRMMESIRSRDRLLASAREETLRNERIVAVATLAAGAAHELGTPLSTIAILSNELLDDDLAEETRENLKIIRNQVDQCKNTLSVLLANADSSRPIQSHNMALADQVARIVNNWKLMRPNVSITQINKQQDPGPILCFDQTLDQALLNLLNNAADVSPQSIEVELGWDERNVTIEIRDLGPGLSKEALQKAGKAFYSSKSGEGLGIGMYLANATIERFSGSVHLYNRDDAGAVITVVLPCIQLQVEAT